MQQFIDGQYVRTIKINGNKKQKTLKEQILRAKRARRDARLVQILTR
jgi:hypothetical protein